MMDISGSMCVHYSSMGNSEKENGISNKLFLIWLKHHGLKRTPLLLHENVQSFPLDYLKERASHYGYTHIARIETSGSDVNLNAVSRKRASLGFALEYISFVFGQEVLVEPVQMEDKRKQLCAH